MSPSVQGANQRSFQGHALVKLTGRRVGAIVALVIVWVCAWSMVAYLAPVHVGRAMGFFPALFVPMAVPIWVVLLQRRLDVIGDTLSVNRGRLGTFPLAGATLGPWDCSGLTGPKFGTVLHLRDEDRSFRVAGRDHRLGPGRRAEAQAVQDVDIVLSATDFDALLATLPPSVLGP